MESLELPILPFLRQGFSSQDLVNLYEIATGNYDSLSEIELKAMNYEPYKYSYKLPLTSASLIGENKVFPPANQRSRISTYFRNKQIYNNELKAALPGIKSKIAVLMKYSALKGISAYLMNPITENYCRTITEAKLNFIYSTGIKIRSYKGDDRPDIDKVWRILRNERILPKVIVDISRFGEAVVVVEKGRKPRYIEPSSWFPVVNAETNEVTCHIIVNKYRATIEDKVVELMRVDYHYKGYYDRAVYKFNGGGLGERLSLKAGIKTGIPDDFAVVVFNTSLDELNLFGSDDYTLILAQIEDLVVTNCIESFCLHKFHFPSFQGPAVAVAKQPDGSNGFEMSNYYALSPNGTKVEQIPVDFNIDAILAHKDNLKRTIAMLSGMKGTINDQKENGYAESGKARELRYADDITTTNKIKTFIEVKIQELVEKEGRVEGLSIDRNEVDVVWSPSLQMNQFDRAELAQVLLGNQQIMSREQVYEDVYEVDNKTSSSMFNEYLKEQEKEQSNQSKDNIKEETYNGSEQGHDTTITAVKQ